MHRSPGLTALALSVGLSACAHTSETVVVPPDYTQIGGEPAPPHARLYADCIAQAVATGGYDRVRDPDTELVRFQCTGVPARAFYDALGPWSASIGSEFAGDGRTFRSTAKVDHNLFGVDLCSMDAAGDARCEINLNAGEFLAR